MKSGNGNPVPEERVPAVPDASPLEEDRRGFAWFLGALGPWIRPYRGLAFAVAAALAIDVAYEAAFPLALKLLIDHAIVPKDARMLAVVSAGFALLCFSAGAAAILRDRLYSRLSAAIVADLRRAMHAQLMRLSIGFFGRARSSDLVANFSSDLASVENAVVLSLPMGASSVASVLVSIAILFVLEWRMALLATAGLGICLALPALVSTRARRAGDDLKARQADVARTVQESIRAQPLIQAFGLQRLMTMRFEAEVSRAAASARRANFLGYLLERIPHLGVIVFNLAVLVIGARLAFAGEIEVGTLVAFQALVINLSGSLWGITLVIPHFVQAIAGLKRVDSLLAERPEIADAPAARPAPRLERAIEFERVGFRHAAAQRGIHDASFRIEAGTRAVFVGASGSGKSTILALMLRFHDPQSGAVRVDGLDLRELTQASLRAQRGVVLQESFLFDASALENLRMVDPGASHEEIVAACREADIHDEIAALPQGYDTPLGEGGNRLSGGQRQRLAIARALLGHPALLFLDEPTSALDAQAEALVQRTLERATRGRTVVWITHRLSCAVDADRVFVMDEGRLVESGTHAELIGRGGTYARLWEKQTGVAMHPSGDWASVDARRLAAVPLLATLDPGLLATLSEAFATEQIAADRTVIHQGDVGDRFYVIARGRVEVLRTDASGVETRVAVLADGDHFGETALLSNAPRNASVRTLTPTTALVLPRGQFLRLVGESREIRELLEAAMRERAPSADS